MANRMEPILPGSYLGILGGGQLGRMFTQAAQAMGYKVCVLDPGSDSPAGSIAEKFIQADYTDSAALKQMANLCAAVSTEFENVPAQALDELESLGAFVAPRSSCVSLAQNRIAEKNFLATWKSETNIGQYWSQTSKLPRNSFLLCDFVPKKHNCFAELQMLPKTLIHQVLVQGHSQTQYLQQHTN